MLMGVLREFILGSGIFGFCLMILVVIVVNVWSLNIVGSVFELCCFELVRVFWVGVWNVLKVLKMKIE